MAKPGNTTPIRPRRAALRDDAAQLRLIADNVPAMSIAYDEHLICLFANRRFAEFFGLSTETIVGKHLREIVGEAPYREVKPYFDRVLAGHRTTYKRTRMMGDGERRYLEVELIPHIAGAGVRGLFAVTTDVTERRREEHLRTLGLSVAALIADAESSSTAIRSVIRAICESEGWECGRYLRPAPDGSLRQADAWGIDDAVVQRFLERMGDIRHRPGVGLAGSVWQSGEPLWVADIAGEPRSLLRGMTYELDVRGAFHFPVKSDGRTIGVLSFNSRERREPDARLLSVILAIGSQIGQFLERKRAEERLRESEEHYRHTFELAGSGVAHIGLDRRFIRANRRLCEILGYSEAELLQLTGRQISHPGDLDVINAQRPLLYAGQIDRVHVEKRYVRKDGSTVWVAFSMVVERDAEGRPLYEIAIFDDITARKAAEEALREGEARFRTLVESTNEGILVYDRELNIVSANGAAERILGLPKERLIGQPGFVALLPCIREDGSPVSQEDRSAAVAMRTRQPIAGRVIGIGRAAGATTWLACNTALLYEASGRAGEPYGAVTTLTDITQLKRDEALLRLEQRLAKAFDSAKDAPAALAAAIQAVCESEHWDSGRYLEAAGGELRYFADWCIDEPQMRRYIEESRTATYRPGVGLLGTAWQEREPLWVPDITNDPRVARPGLAQALGARGALVVPVLALDEVIGVFIFQSREVRQPDQRLLQAMQLIGGQIGQLVRRAKAEAAVRESEARFRSLCELSSDVFWEQDAQLRYTSVSDASGLLDPAEMIGKTRWEHGALNLSAQDWEAHRAVLEAHRPFRDLELCRADRFGNHTWYSVSGEPVFDAAGAFAGYRGVGRNITARKLDERRIRHLASHDALTGLPNRTAFSELLNAARASARRHARSLAVMFVDLDRFKVINDTLGHEAGDQVLCEAARRLRHTLRASDVVARLGGDEFVVMLPELESAAQAETAARKVLAALVAPMLVAGRELTLTASIGICLYPQDGEDEQSLMKNADTAMYRAKEAGKNNFKFHNAAADRRSLERLAMETSLRRGLERGELFLHYQPRVALASGAVTGVEALARWRHPELGVVPPGEFIALAEETGIIHEVGRWVLEAACAQAAEWRRAGLPPLHMAVNVSARQFGSDNLVAHVAAALEASGLAAQSLELEITESVVAQNVPRAAQILVAIRALGVRVALDDFGTGYSSLAQLKRFPIDTLKVDRAFVAELPHNPDDVAIARAIIAMGRSLRLVVVAEGVETAEQHAFLREQGCDEVQGFLVSPPLGAAECAEFLRRPIARGG
jgi:diguanylate cyclase (GGDEF)-like protein/PAS domain S-box-containing protein